MTCGFSEIELKILYKITYKRRWCPKHISLEDLLSGNPKHMINEYREAVEHFIKKGWLQAYKSQDRIDVCIDKAWKNELLKIFKIHAKEYSFIKNIEFIK
ncbi:MAG: hypothetical protein C3F06_08705 [Candidatus Methanoperedenaceae archaeon]|nr:MAG: hypothetical protein C3F06_08705 [Candidatus Methanoperedenaceae archaeon]